MQLSHCKKKLIKYAVISCLPICNYECVSMSAHCTVHCTYNVANERACGTLANTLLCSLCA